MIVKSNINGRENVGFNPFASIGLPGMLNKIAIFTCGVSIFAVWLLRHESPSVEAFLASLTLPVPIATGLAIPLGTILPAFLIALVSRIFKLHNHLSNILGIRHRFDLEAILFPLAIATSIAFPVEKVRQIKKQRKDLMYKTFYKYASSSPSKAVIETHYITMALDQ